MTPQAAARYKEKLAEYIPSASVESIFDFMVRYAVQFRITRQRSSKLGDYRWPRPTHEYHEISINGDLEKEFFLWVLLHEMGHLTCWLKYKNSVQGHGHEWQNEYREHIIRHYNLGAFSQQVMPLVAKYVKKIPLNHAIGNQIEDHFRRQQSDFIEEDLLLLNDLQPGQRFVLKSHPDRVFVAQEKRRTRWKCRSEADGAVYLVNGSAPVVLL